MFYSKVFLTLVLVFTLSVSFASAQIGPSFVSSGFEQLEKIVGTNNLSAYLPSLPNGDGKILVREGRGSPALGDFVANVSAGWDNAKRVATKLASRIGEIRKSQNNIKVEETSPTVTAPQPMPELNQAAINISVQNVLNSLKQRFVATSSPVQPSAQAQPAANPARESVAQPARVDTSLLARITDLENLVRNMRSNLTRQNDRIVQTISTSVSEGTESLSSVTGTFSSNVSIAGLLVLSGGTTTAASGFDISGGCFSISGTCVGSGGGTGVLSIGPAGQGQTGSTLTLASSTTGTDFTITASGNTITWNLPSASASVRGLLSLADWSVFNNKVSTTSIDTIGEVETLWGVSNILVEADMDASSELGALMDDETGAGGLLVFNSSPTLAGFLSTASSTLQNFTFVNATGTSATTTNFFATTASSTNLFATTGRLATLLLNGSTTLQNFTFVNATGTSATTTNFFATTASSTNLYASIATLNALRFNTVGTTTIGTGWHVATTTATAATQVMSIQNNGATTTISFFGATTTGLTAGTGLALPSAVKQMLIIGGSEQAGVAITRGGLCVDSDGWCTASTTGRISSVTSTTGNSDLAEAYESSEDLEPGDVVSSSGGISVVRATDSNREHMMGVVSTAPGIILGLSTDESLSTPGKFPIALSGRIPTKVNIENGVIKAGDYLTLSSVPGVAAKALKADVVIGQALEGFSGAGVGRVMVFVKNSYYSGISAEKLLGLSGVGSLPNSKQILGALVSGALTTPSRISNISTDTLLAGIEIITPKLTAHLVQADVIESPTIDALVARIEALEQSQQNTSLFTTAIQNVTEWVGSKITAALGVFERIEIGTARVSKGIELIDSTTGATYCLTIKNGEWDKAAGECGTPEQSPVEPPPPPIHEEQLPAAVDAALPEEPEIEPATEPATAPEVQPELETTTPDAPDAPAEVIENIPEVL